MKDLEKLDRELEQRDIANSPSWLDISVFCLNLFTFCVVCFILYRLLW
jgi:hypothetical protein